LERPLSWSDVSGTEGLLMVGATMVDWDCDCDWDCEGWEIVAVEVGREEDAAAAAAGCWVEGEGAECPLTRGVLSPLVSAMVNGGGETVSLLSLLHTIPTWRSFSSLATELWSMSILKFGTDRTLKLTLAGAKQAWRIVMLKCQK